MAGAPGQAPAALVCMLLLLVSASQIVHSEEQRAADANSHHLDQAEMLLDSVEGGISSLKGVWNAQRSLIRAAAFRTAGMPIMEAGWSKLSSSYSDARAALKEEMPTLMKARELLPKLSEEAQQTFALLREAQVKVTALTKDFEAAKRTASAAQSAWERMQKDGSSALADSKEFGKTKDEALRAFAEAQEKMVEAVAMQDKAMEQYEESRRLYEEALKSMNSLRAVVDAVDPQHVQEIIQGMGAGVMSCVAAVKAPAAASAVVGVDAGRILSTRLLPAMHSQLSRRLPMGRKTKQWVDSAVSSACQGLGILLAFKMQSTMLTFSASFIGARLVAHFLSEQVEIMSGLNMERITVERVLTPRHSTASDLPPRLRTDAGGRLAKLSAQSCLELALAGASLYWQYVGEGAQLETKERVLFAPLLMFETWLRAMAAAAPTAAAA